MKKNIYILIALIASLYSSRAHAYIDPGTGALVVQALIGLFVTAIVTVKMWWQKFLQIISREKKENDGEETKD